MKKKKKTLEKNGKKEKKKPSFVKGIASWLFIFLSVGLLSSTKGCQGRTSRLETFLALKGCPWTSMCELQNTESYVKTEVGQQKTS